MWIPQACEVRGASKADLPLITDIHGVRSSCVQILSR
jgi:hypothetical protein